MQFLWTDYHYSCW